MRFSCWRLLHHGVSVTNIKVAPVCLNDNSSVDPAVSEL